MIVTQDWWDVRGRMWWSNLFTHVMILVCKCHEQVWLLQTSIVMFANVMHLHMSGNFVILLTISPNSTVEAISSAGNNHQLHSSLVSFHRWKNGQKISKQVGQCCKHPTQWAITLLRPILSRANCSIFASISFSFFSGFSGSFTYFTRSPPMVVFCGFCVLQTNSFPSLSPPCIISVSFQ